jgi:hypothetical protein
MVVRVGECEGSQKLTKTPKRLTKPIKLRTKPPQGAMVVRVGQCEGSHKKNADD